jgi:hypothetical protein
MDLVLDEFSFVPRVPIYRCKEEDSITKRICVCPSLEEAISAFPYKGYFANFLLTRKKDNYLSVFKTNTDNYLDHEQIHDRVPDPHITKEHWLLEPFKSKPQIIKINKLTLTGYNKYTYEYHGQVKELEYEADTVQYDRYEEFTLLSKQMFNKFCKVADNNGMSIDILEDRHMRLMHRYDVPSTKRYRWIVVKVHIPSGVSVAPLWLLNDKQNEFAMKKKILFIEGVEVDYDDDDIYNSMVRLEDFHLFKKHTGKGENNMLTKHDFILYRSIFDKVLFEAIANKNVDKVEEIFKSGHKFEINSGFICDRVSAPIDIDKLNSDFVEQNERNDYSWAV